MPHVSPNKIHSDCVEGRIEVYKINAKMNMKLDTVVNSISEWINLINAWAVLSKSALILPEKTLHSDIHPPEQYHLQRLWCCSSLSDTPAVAAIWNIPLLPDNNDHPFNQSSGITFSSQTFSNNRSCWAVCWACKLKLSSYTRCTRLIRGPLPSFILLSYSWMICSRFSNLGNSSVDIC